MGMPVPSYDFEPSASNDEGVEFEASSVEEAFEKISVPLGFRAELINGDIVVSPPADGNHEFSIERVVRQIHLASLDELIVSGGKGIITPNGRCIPDITVGTVEAFLDKEPWSGTTHVRLVAEVTSSNAEWDREVKRHRYAAADIPLYLLVDRQERTVTLFSEPDVETADYRQTYTVDYGKPLPLPEPFGFDLDTSQLP